MDIVHARAHLRLEMRLVERVEQLEVGTARLERNHVGIHGVDIADNVVELAVAHVRVDLRLGLDLRVHQAERGDGPVEVFLVPVALAQRQLLAEGGLVDLDNLDAVLFEVQDFVADGKADLLGLRLERNIFARERPVENRHGAGEHALHGLVRLLLGEHGPFDGDWLAAVDIAPHDRRLDAARAVALHPGVLREDEPVDLRSKIFHHVVAFEFAMHDYVEADAFLERDAFRDFLLVERHVLLAGDFALLEGGAVRADFGRLRERPDGRRGERREPEDFLLHLLAVGAGRTTHEVGIAEGGQRGLHCGILAHADGGKQGLVLFEGGCIGIREVGKFHELFLGEGEMFQGFGGEFLLGGNGVRHVQQGAGGAHNDVGGIHGLLDFGEEGVLLRIIGAPDVLAVHHARKEDRVLRETGLDEFERLEAFHKVEADAVEAKRNDILINVADIAEIGL